MIKETTPESALSIKCVTWIKDSHSLFDYQYNKNVVQSTNQFPLHIKYVYMYRNNQTSQISFKKKEELVPDKQNCLQLLGAFFLHKNQIQGKYKVEFFTAKYIKSIAGQDLTDQSEEEKQIKNEDIYLIVRSLKNKNNQNIGYKLAAGQIVKFGRIQYMVSAINGDYSSNNQIKSKFWSNNKCIKVQDRQTAEVVDCKYCMLPEGTQLGQFLCTPCRCSGTCGAVHFKCLQKWNQSKVKKQTIGQATQYNFQKFYCEVCKDEYPRYVKKNQMTFELMPIQKPTGQFVILDSISQKANNLIVLKNLQHTGIKIGRGNDCQIRLTDISVSRNHARVQKHEDNYVLFDNKSKFGTLVKEDKLIVDLSKMKKGIQIGRTVMTFQKIIKPTTN